MVAIAETINAYWNQLLLDNEKLRFSLDSKKAFQQLEKIYKYKEAGKEGGIVDSIKREEGIINNLKKRLTPS